MIHCTSTVLKQPIEVVVYKPMHQYSLSAIALVDNWWLCSPTYPQGAGLTLQWPCGWLVACCEWHFKTMKPSNEHNQPLWQNKGSCSRKMKSETIKKNTQPIEHRIQNRCRKKERKWNQHPLILPVGSGKSSTLSALAHLQHFLEKNTALSWQTRADVMWGGRCYPDKC